MVDHEILRRLVLALPEGADASGEGRLSYTVAGKGLAWTWNERAHPKKPRIPRPGVLAVRCSFERREMLLDAAPDRFFIDDHYRSYPGVLVRLDAVDEDEMRGMLDEAWKLTAPKALLKAREAGG